MVNIRTESPIDTYFSVQYGHNSNFDGSEKNYLDVFIYINGSKVYPGKSSSIFHSKNIAVNNVNDLRLIFNILVQRGCTSRCPPLWPNSLRGMK